ncbi:MAG TPA: hypothetical protein VKR56_05035 [Candidatus Cybelea sp.]|nr:hypothetical protein [Candidatus Cybelea sp.]
MISRTRNVRILVVVALGLGGCSSTASTTPAAPARSDLRSWISPDAKKSDLLYVADKNSLYIFTYPAGNRVGRIAVPGYTQGICADRKGNVYVPSEEYDTIGVYAHGGTTQVRMLSNPNEDMIGCSVSPLTSDLAVIDAEGTKYAGGAVSIYRKAKGNPSVYMDSSMAEARSGSYDGAGDIFVDGFDRSNNFVFAELPEKGVGFKTITLNESIEDAGDVQWDGTYVTIGSKGAVYQTNGAGGEVVGMVTLNDTEGPTDYVVDSSGGTLVGSSGYESTAAVLLWPYPTGGNPTSTLTGFDLPFGVAISFARHRK